VLTRDLTDTTGLKLTPKGEVQSNGVELDIMGSITDNWKIVANFAYNDVKITKSNTETEIGQRFSNSIPVLANLWTVYKFDKVIKGFRIGAGLNYSDKRLIVADPKLEAPAYTLLNALVGYEIGNLELTVNINNISNVDYVAGSAYNSPNYIFRGAPTNFLMSLRYRFTKI
jgi:outer membrane receptor protein involved in Fe transport